MLCLLLAGLTACSTGRAPYKWHELGNQKPQDVSKKSTEADSWGAEAESADAPDPRIAPGFLLALSSMEDRKLNGDFRVDFDGILSPPYNVSLNASGLTLSQVKKKLEELYRPYFKSSPEFDLRVKERRYMVDVRGLVQKPGRVLLEPNVSLDQVIILAGGLIRETPPQFVRLQKGTKSFAIDLNQYYGRGEAHPQIQGWLGGETVFFQKDSVEGDRPFAAPYRLPITLLGEVRKPGEYPLKPGADFVDSLIMADGFTDRADLEKIEVIRRTGGRRRVYEFPWRDFHRAPPPVQGDVYLVHAQDRARFDHGVQIATLLISLLGTLAIVYELERTNDRR